MGMDEGEVVVKRMEELGAFLSLRAGEGMQVGIDRALSGISNEFQDRVWWFREMGVDVCAVGRRVFEICCSVSVSVALDGFSLPVLVLMSKAADDRGVESE